MSLPDPADQLLTQLGRLRDDDERRRFFESRPDLVRPAVAVRLCDEAGRLLWADLEQARAMVRGARWIGDRVDDEACRARVLRAEANVLYLSSDYAAALRGYERAVETFERLGDREQAAVTRSSGLQSLSYLGQYDRARSWAATARETFHELGDELRLTILEFNVANILFRQDRWEEAIAIYRRCHRRFEELEEDVHAAHCLRVMAVCLINLNDFKEALDAYERARELCHARGLEGLALENDYNIAYLYFLRGEYTRALQLYQKARLGCERLDNVEHLALCDLDQAEIFLELNLVEEAAELGQSAFDRFDRLGMRYEAAKGLTLLAIALSRQGKAFLALDLLGKAREMFVGELNHLWPAQIDLYRALVLYGEGRLVEAESLGQRALEVFRQVGVATKTAMCLTLLARLDVENGRTDSGKEKSLQALELLRPLEVPALEYQAYFVLGQLEEARGDATAALEAYRSSHERLERLRSHLQADELKITYLEDRLAVYENLVALILTHKTGAAGKKEAFSYIEKAKSRSLADLISFRAHALPPKGGTRSKLADRVRDLREELNWYYRQIDLRQMRADERSLEQAENLRQESRRRESQLMRTMQELQSTDQELSSLQDAATIPLTALQSALPSGTTLLEYYIAQGVVYGCVLTRDALDIVPLTVASRVRELRRLLHFQLSKFLLGADHVQGFRDIVDEASRTHLRSLHEELIAPLGGRLEGDRLTIVPHDFLHHLPFHAFLDGEAHLIDRFPVSYSPSASVHYLSRMKRPSAARNALVLGIAEDRRSPVRRQVEAVAETLPDCRLLWNEEADERVLKTEGAECRILHLATHGIFRRDNPMFSALQLGTSRLSLFDLYSLRLEADLVFVSGCGIGLGAGGGGDDLVGLARGLLFAGARAVVLTLWDPRDESAVDFVRPFYLELQEGRSLAEALRRAAVVCRQRHPHPYHWAPYLLIGPAD